MKFETTMIKPEMALRLLKLNTGNRAVQIRHVDFLANEIKNNRFKQTGETIKISKTNKLVDGQHRLMAIVKANRGVILTICSGVEDDTFNVIDTGRVRSSADVLFTHGLKNANNLASAVRYSLMLKNNQTNTKGVRYSNQEILDYSCELSGLSDIVNYCCTNRKKFSFMPPSAIAALYFSFEKTNAIKCESFFDSFYSGLNIDATNPVYLLRDRLLGIRLIKLN
jgi:hypothetical protein